MTYYRVLPYNHWGSHYYKVQTWRWWFPIWITSVKSLYSKGQADEWVRCHSEHIPEVKPIPNN